MVLWFIERFHFYKIEFLVFVLTFFSMILFLSPSGHYLFITLTKAAPLFMGFLKFFLFASFGELISIRISAKAWRIPRGFLYSACLWGFIGSMVSLSFEFYSSGIKHLLSIGMLPGKESRLSYAFFTSLFNNLTFAPVMMSFHKLCHTYLELRFEKGKRNCSYEDVVDSIDWKNFFTTVCLKKIPLFWIPIHTLNFLLPPDYRVLVASVLSMVLGIFLTQKKKACSQS